MRKWMISIVILCLMTMTGCAFVDGLWAALSGQDRESTKVAKEIIDKGAEIAAESNATDLMDEAKKLAKDLKEGKIDADALMSFFTDVSTSVKDSKENVKEMAILFKNYTEKNEDEKPGPWETAGAAVGIAVLGYLGMHKGKNTKAGSKIGNGLNSILGFILKLLTLGGSAKTK